MSLEIFKNIENQIGYVVNETDRDIFQKALRNSYFGKGSFDFIEFIIYDSNDNQLPQASVNGDLVRYLYLDNPDIQKYFIIAESNSEKTFGEYIIDLEKLISEAGYSNGIFKTRVTLLNRRVGFHKGKNDKLWIHEIAPSRTEIRVLPVRNPNIIPDLEKRYSVFTEGGNFKDDTVYFIDAFIEKLDIQTTIENLIQIGGGVFNGKRYYDQIKMEFKIDDMETFLLNVKKYLLEGFQNYYNGRRYLITAAGYGEPLDTFDNIELSIDGIKQLVENILISVLDFLLLKRDIPEDTYLDYTTLETIDELKSIITTTSGNRIFDTTIEGCMDSAATNYNPSATQDDDSCIYNEQPILGCTDKGAINYNRFASVDDGSCKYGSNLVTKKWYVYSRKGYVIYKNGDGIRVKQDGERGDSFTISYLPPIEIYGDVRDVPIPEITKKTYKKYRLTNSRHLWFGLTNAPENIKISYKDKNGGYVEETIKLGDGITICADMQDINFDPKRISIKEIGEC